MVKSPFEKGGLKSSHFHMDNQLQNSPLVCLVTLDSVQDDSEIGFRNSFWKYL